MLRFYRPLINLVKKTLSVRDPPLGMSAIPREFVRDTPELASAIPRLNPQVDVLGTSGSPQTLLNQEGADGVAKPHWVVWAVDALASEDWVGILAPAGRAILVKWPRSARV